MLTSAFTVGSSAEGLEHLNNRINSTAWATLIVFLVVLVAVALISWVVEGCVMAGSLITGFSVTGC